MSEIDLYRHSVLGIIECPTPYPFVFGSSTRDVYLYKLEEDVRGAANWVAKKGDIVLGGGSGEAAIFRASMPEAIFFFTNEKWDAFDSISDIYCAYWNVTEAFIFGSGYAKLGWSPNVPLESWLAEHLVSFVLQQYPKMFQSSEDSLNLDQDGRICRAILE